MDGKVRVELKDEDLSLRVTPDFVHKFVVSIDGLPYLDYGDGDEPIELYGNYEEIMVATAKVEQVEKDKRNRK